MSNDQPCPCHSGLSYQECCSQYHAGAVPKTATALMRSRYAAYALKLPEYVIATTHPNNKQYTKNTAAWTQSIQEFCEHTHYLSLAILDETERGTTATVTFRAGLVQTLQDVSFTERSTFQKVNGRWLYLSECEIIDGEKSAVMSKLAFLACAACV